MKPLISVFCVALLSAYLPTALCAPRAFPGAEGYGAYARGGRGGKVHVVTTLADYGSRENPIPGSLRAAVEAEGPRIIVFRVGGTIELKSKLVVRKPFLTIAGQSAPGGGVCLRNWNFGVSAEDVIIPHLRVRPGDTAKTEMDGLSVVGGKNVILDHCSVSWGIDETLSVTHDSDRVTVQWCMITEALHNSYHVKGNHGYGSLINGGRISWHHNLYANHRSRNPRPADVYLDFINNVIYNWGGRSGYNGNDDTKMNYVGNYLRPGPSTPEGARGFAFFLGGMKSRLYVKDNRIEGAPEKDGNNRLMVRQPDGTGPEALDTILRPDPWPTDQGCEIKVDPADVAYQRVLTDCGATLPKRDAVDLRLVQQIKDNTGKHIDSQEQVGGWPALEPGTPPADTDQDGMPDTWERDHQLNPADASDNNGDADGDGYTNIEEYLNATDPRKAD